MLVGLVEGGGRESGREKREGKGGGKRGREKGEGKGGGKRGREKGETHVPAIVVGALAQYCWLRGRRDRSWLVGKPKVRGMAWARLAIRDMLRASMLVGEISCSVVNFRMCFVLSFDCAMV